MDENERIANWRARKKERASAERKCDYPMIPFPKDGKVTVKNIAYLNVYCRVSPELIAAWSKVHLADVHLALCHYHRNPKPINAEIEREMEFNRRDSLGDASMSLPSVGLTALVETLKEGA